MTGDTRQMADRIKVTELITTMADGGAETLVKDYALKCDRSRIDMQIITWSEPLGSANEQTLREAGIEVIHLGDGKTSVGPLGKIQRRISKFRRFRSIILNGHVDVIHVHLRFGRYLRALPHSALKRISLFYTLHNEPDKYFDPHGNSKQRFEYREARRLIRHYGLTMIALHEDMNRQVRELFGTDRVVTVNNGIDCDRFDRALYDRSSVRATLGISGNAFVIGHVGSYTVQKNHEFILKVFDEYLKGRPNAVLLLTGKGVLKDEIIRKTGEMGLSDKVIFLENRADIPALMSAMDVFLLPSRWEGFPVVMIEAQHMGLPCVISDRINPDVVLSDNVTMLSLEAPVSEWIDAIEGRGAAAEVHGDPLDYDIRRSVDKLTELYQADPDDVIFVTISMTGGGTERVISTLANAMVRKGSHVRILMIGGDDIAYELDERIDIRCISKATDGDTSARFDRIRALRDEFRINPCADIIAMGTVASMFASIASMGLSNRLILSERNDPDRLNHKPIRRSERILRNILYRRADHIVFQTPMARDRFPEYIRNRSSIIMNPIRDDIPAAPSYKEREKVILSAGRLTAQKNQKLLIDAFVDVHNTHPDYSLEIYGEGEDREMLDSCIRESGAEEYIKLMGFCPDILSRMCSSRIYVSCSDWEGISNSLAEAMACGMAVVATDCPMGGNAMLTEDNVNGRLIPAADKDALTNALNDIIEDDELGARLSTAASGITKRLNTEKILTEWIK